jgi:hypothetical protein
MPSAYMTPRATVFRPEASSPSGKPRSEYLPSQSTLSTNPGPRCFAREKQHADIEVEGVAAELKAEELKAEEHRQKHKPRSSEGYEPEVSRAWAIRERRRASVRTCERDLQSAIASEDVRLTRRWSRSLREAQARVVWAEADLEASKKRAQSEQRR